jgi:phospholipid/cholesterol/gamma-HCH transport system permease protein
VCADLGARTIREEVAAMETLGIHPIHRLVVPRVVAFGVVSVGLFAIVATVGLVGSYVFSTVAQGGSPGLFVQNLTLLTSLSDFMVSILKTAVFGVAAGLVACYLGLHVKGGPKGVGDAVNQTVIFSLMLLMALNTLITSIYFQIAR